MVYPDVWITSSTETKSQIGIHSWKILCFYELKHKLFVLFLDTCRHPRLSFLCIWICADLQLGCLISWALNIDRNRKISCDLCLVFSIRICERDRLVMDYMILHLINCFGGHCECTNRFRLEESFVLDLDCDHCFFDFGLL